MLKSVRRFATVSGAVAAALALSATAYAGMAQSSLVSTNPVNYTPQLAGDATVSHPATYALEQSGSTMYVGGQFHSVLAGGATVVRPNFVAFNATTGALSGLSPNVNGPVWAIRAYNGSVYIGGEFTTVTGPDGVAVTRRGLAKIDAATGAVDPGFKAPWASGQVHDMQIVNGRVIVGGTFGKHLLSLDPTTGADTGYINVPISGTCVDNPACGTGGSPATSQPTDVYRFAVSSDGTRLVGIGNFSAPHPRAFMVDLGATSATLDSWYYARFAESCILPKTYPAYLRDVDFSPDGSYFVIVATGYVVQNNDPARLGLDVCDAAARFETNIANPSRATWINYTGGDTLHSTVVTGAAVYVQGHNRWMDNAGGQDFCNGDCFAASPGIQALDPATGKAIRTWTAPKTRGVGGKDLLATNLGLWVGSDGKTIKGETHQSLALLPLP